MRVSVLTLFPGMFAPVLGSSIIGKACERGDIAIDCYNIRDYSADKHKQADDYTFGGGAGMLMMPQPIFDCFKAVKEAVPGDCHSVFLSPRGKRMDMTDVKRLSGHGHLILLCGHYEGVDQRVIDNLIDEELSIGDYVLTGGELPAMVLIDAVSRHIEGVLGSGSSLGEESFADGLLEYPQYTRPQVYDGLEVPEVLINGHHANIKKWRREQSLAVTLKNRPELLIDARLSQEDIDYLEKLTRK